MYVDPTLVTILNGIHDGARNFDKGWKTPNWNERGEESEELESIENDALDSNLVSLPPFEMVGRWKRSFGWFGSSVTSLYIRFRPYGIEGVYVWTKRIKSDRAIDLLSLLTLIY